jgi:hypothetical protein
VSWLFYFKFNNLKYPAHKIYIHLVFTSQCRCVYGFCTSENLITEDMINMDISETSTKSEPLLIYEKMNTVHSGQGWCCVRVIHKTQHLRVHFKHDLSTGNTVHNVSKHLNQKIKQQYTRWYKAYIWTGFSKMDPSFELSLQKIHCFVFINMSKWLKKAKIKMRFDREN